MRGALGPDRARLLYRLPLLLPARLPHGERQHCSTGRAARPRTPMRWFGIVLGPVFHRYQEGYRFGKLACDLVEKHGFIAYQAKVYLSMGWLPSGRSRSTTAIDFIRAAFRAASETGDLTYACYSMRPPVTDLLLRNDPLDEVWREFGERPGLRPEGQVRRRRRHHREPATLHRDHAGPDRDFSTFSDAQFDEAAFEAQLTADRMAMMVCWYWILKLQGAVPVRRLRRGARGSRQGEGAALDLGRAYPVARLLLLHRADGGGALRERYCRRADAVARSS